MNPEVELPADFEQKLEACFDFIRSQFLEPGANKDPRRLISIAMQALTQFLTSLDAQLADLAESEIFIQAVALMSVVYHLSGYSPGEWFADLKIDMSRAYIAIVLLYRIGAVQEAAEAAAAAVAVPAPAPESVAPAADVTLDPNAVH